VVLFSHGLEIQRAIVTTLFGEIDSMTMSRLLRLSSVCPATQFPNTHANFYTTVRADTDPLLMVLSNRIHSGSAADVA